MLVTYGETRRKAWVDLPEPNSNTRFGAGKTWATSARNSQLNGGRIQAGARSLSGTRWYFAMTASS